MNGLCLTNPLTSHALAHQSQFMFDDFGQSVLDVGRIYRDSTIAEVGRTSTLHCDHSRRKENGTLELFRNFEKEDRKP